MKKYTVDEPEFNKTLIITETTDTGHADNINKAPKMAFENTLYLEKTKLDADGGDISEAVIKAADEIEDDEYPIPASGDKPRTFLGKTKKFLGNIKDWMTGVCLLGQIVNNCVTDNAKLPLSAAQGKALMDLYNVLNTNRKNGDIGMQTIATFKSPSQLSHNGFYSLYNCTSDVNDNLDSGAGSFTDYAVGDFCAILLTNQCTKEKGCRYGTLIVASPRFVGRIWIGRIWEFRFTHWHKVAGT